MNIGEQLENSVCVCTHSTQHEFSKVRFICKNLFSDKGIRLIFEKLATNRVDTDFNYAIMVKRTDGRKISKSLLENIVVSVESVICTVKSF